MQATIGTEKANVVKADWISSAKEWMRGLSFPIPLPQLTPVAMMLLFAFLVFSQTVSADGSLQGVYQKSFELAEQTYQQSANVWNGTKIEQQSNQEPVSGTYINSEENKQ